MPGDLKRFLLTEREIRGGLNIDIRRGDVVFSLFKTFGGTTSGEKEGRIFLQSRRKGRGTSWTDRFHHMRGREGNLSPEEDELAFAD